MLCAMLREQLAVDGEFGVGAKLVMRCSCGTIR